MQFAALLTIAVPLGLAVLTFISIQRYMNDPRRRELNEIWFAQYNAFIDRQYLNSESYWRAKDLKGHFCSQDR